MEKVQEFMREQAKPIKKMQETLRNMNNSLEKFVSIFIYIFKSKYFKDVGLATRIGQQNPQFNAKLLCFGPSSIQSCKITFIFNKIFIYLDFSVLVGSASNIRRARIVFSRQFANQSIWSKDFAI